MSFAFRKALISLSFAATQDDDWKSTREQWRLVKCQQFKRYAYCICGVACKNCFIIENSASGYRCTVGGKCINQFIHLPEFASLGWICDVCEAKPTYASFDAYIEHCHTSESHINRTFTPLPTTFYDLDVFAYVPGNEDESNSSSSSSSSNNYKRKTNSKKTSTVITRSSKRVANKSNNNAQQNNDDDNEYISVDTEDNQE
jgi:hypothetical protein